LLALRLNRTRLARLLSAATEYWPRYGNWNWPGSPWPWPRSSRGGAGADRGGLGWGPTAAQVRGGWRFRDGSFWFI